MWSLLLPLACHAPVDGAGDSGPPAHDTAVDELPAPPMLNEIDPFVSGGPDVIELYNPSNAEVDLTGAVLESIDVNQQEAWPFPDGTVIGPGEHLVVYCDEYEFGDQGLHASFRLAREGGDVIFVYPWQGSVAVERVPYSSMPYDASYARVPDGGGWWVLPGTSPGQSNGHLVTPTASGTINADGLVALDGMELNHCDDAPVTRAFAELDLTGLEYATYATVRVAFGDDEPSGVALRGYDGDGQITAEDDDRVGQEVWTYWTAAGGVLGIWADIGQLTGWLGVRVETSVCMPDPLVVTEVTMVVPD